MNKELRLGVNIDHVATLREARKTSYPLPLYAALEAEAAGAHGITLHLREDRRHINERDVLLIKENITIPMNFEMAVTNEMIDFALSLMPENICLVPERREEITTEGGLDVIGNFSNIASACDNLQKNGSEVSLFIDPCINQIAASKEVGAKAIEIHTGSYANAHDKDEVKKELVRIRQAVEYAAKLNLIVNAGHGLHYHNVQAIAQMPEINELNIGHAIIARAIFTGLKDAIKQMQALMREARNVLTI